MPIIFLKMDFVGESDVNPRIGRMISTDNYADIIATNYIVPYLNGHNISLESTDIIAASYGDGKGFFNVEISGETINLSPSQTQGDVSVILPTVPDNIPFWDNAAGRLDNTGYEPSDTTKIVVSMVDGPTVASNITFFADTSGTVSDSGVAFSDNTNDFVACVNGAAVVGNIPSFSDNNGTITDSGIDFSNNANPHAVTVSGAITIGHAASFTDTNGSITDSGQRMPFSTDVSGAGGGISNPVTVTGAAVGDIAIYTGLTAINNVACTLCSVTAPNTVTLVFTADPGAFTGKVLVQKAP